MDPAVPTFGSYLGAKSHAADGGPSALAAADSTTIDPLILLAFTAVLVAICWQNWVLARRAEGRSLIPDWLRAQRPG